MIFRKKSDAAVPNMRPFGLEFSGVILIVSFLFLVQFFMT